MRPNTGTFSECTLWDSYCLQNYIEYPMDVPVLYFVFGLMMDQ